MFEEIVSNIVNTTITSFDFTYCVIVNIVTYITITFINDACKHSINTWFKRLIFGIVAIILAILYCLCGSEYKTILNSVIIAPVSWSWIFKPICNKLNIDYKKDNNLNDII